MAYYAQVANSIHNTPVHMVRCHYRWFNDFELDIKYHPITWLHVNISTVFVPLLVHILLRCISVLSVERFNLLRIIEIDIYAYDVCVYIYFKCYALRYLFEFTPNFLLSQLINFFIDNLHSAMVDSLFWSYFGLLLFRVIHLDICSEFTPNLSFSQLINFFIVSLHIVILDPLYWSYFGLLLIWRICL